MPKELMLLAIPFSKVLKDPLTKMGFYNNKMGLNSKLYTGFWQDATRLADEYQLIGGVNSDCLLQNCFAVLHQSHP